MRIPQLVLGVALIMGGFGFWEIAQASMKNSDQIAKQDSKNVSSNAVIVEDDDTDV